MPIPDEKRKELITTFVIAPAGAPWLTLAALARHVPLVVRRHWYALVELSSGKWAVEFIQELVAAGLSLGREEEILTLAQLPLPRRLVAAISVDANQVGWGLAQRRMSQSPYRRLVVTEAGQPIGLLCDEPRSGYPSVLAAIDSPPPTPYLPYRCPACGRTFFLGTGEEKGHDPVHPRGYVICGHCGTKGVLNLTCILVNQKMLVQAQDDLAFYLGREVNHARC